MRLSGLHTHTSHALVVSVGTETYLRKLKDLKLPQELHIRPECVDVRCRVSAVMVAAGGAGMAYRSTCCGDFCDKQMPSVPSVLLFCCYCTNMCVATSSKTCQVLVVFGQCSINAVCSVTT